MVRLLRPLGYQQHCICVLLMMLSPAAHLPVQTFPFSSTRKRMSSLVALGPPLSTPGTAGAASQPARLYVKGAAELLLDSCRLQVGGGGGGRRCLAAGFVWQQVLGVRLLTREGRIDRLLAAA
jgi:magnesium-transporting ATPase (P-type)